MVKPFIHISANTCVYKDSSGGIVKGGGLVKSRKGNTNMTHEEFNKQMLPTCAELLGHYLNVVSELDQDGKQEVDALMDSAYNLGHTDCVNSIAEHFGISLK